MASQIVYPWLWFNEGLRGAASNEIIRYIGRQELLHSFKGAHTVVPAESNASSAFWPLQNAEATCSIQLVVNQIGRVCVELHASMVANST